MSEQDSRPVCRRCGRCCLRGGPALHVQDLHLVERGVLPRARLVTLRAGEPVHENVAGGLVGLSREMVKVAGSGTGFACAFHDKAGSACAIHSDRPAECRALFCEDTSAVEAMYARDRLARADLIDVSGALWELVAFHDQAFPAAMAASLARGAAGGKRRAMEALEELVDAERSFRRAFQERTRAPLGELDFYFGRDLASICAQFGVRFRE